MNKLEAKKRDLQPKIVQLMTRPKPSGLRRLKNGVMPPGFFGVARKEPPRVAVATGKVLDDATTKKTKAELRSLGDADH